MKNILKPRFAGNLVLFFFYLLVIFHLLVILGVLPLNIVWGGQIKNNLSLFIFEGIALAVTILFIIIIHKKIRNIITNRKNKLTNFGIWLIFSYLILNTIGNFTSDITPEKMIFTPITIIMAILTFQIAVEK